MLPRQQLLDHTKRLQLGYTANVSTFGAAIRRG